MNEKINIKNQKIINLLKQLCEIPAVSGREQTLAEFIKKEISSHADDIKQDALGNIIAFKKADIKDAQKNETILLDAHMDEVGFMITAATDDGFLCFTTVGGIEPAVIFGSRVKIITDKNGGNPVSGIIAGQPVHKLNAEERKEIPKSDKLAIDIGAKDKDDALNIISIGETAVFDSEFLQTKNRICSRALDDRAGCAILIELIKNADLKQDTYFTFTVQEEVGLRGAKTASFGINPDMVIAVDVTTAFDVPGEPAHKQVCALGKGPAVSFMDGGAVYDKGLYDRIFEIAKENRIPCQPKAATTGGNNAGALHTAGAGARAAAISVPCRYLHSANGVIDIDDFLNALELVKALI